MKVYSVKLKYNKITGDFDVVLLVTFSLADRMINFDIVRKPSTDLASAGLSPNRYITIAALLSAEKDNFQDVHWAHHCQLKYSVNFITASEFDDWSATGLRKQNPE